MPLPRDRDGSVNWTGSGSVASGLLGGVRGAGRAIVRDIRNDFSRAPTWRDFTGVSAADPLVAAGRGFAEGWRSETGRGGGMPDFRYEAGRMGHEAAAHNSGSVVARGYVGGRGLGPTPGGPGRARTVEQHNALGYRLGEVPGASRSQSWQMPGTDGSAQQSPYAGAQAGAGGRSGVGPSGDRPHGLGGDSMSSSLGLGVGIRGDEAQRITSDYLASMMNRRGLQER